MKRSLFLSILILTFVCSANVTAQSPSKILKQANKALGGEKVLQTIRSWQKTGNITRLKDSASGSFEMRAAQPNFYNSSFNLNGFETVSYTHLTLPTTPYV